MNEVPYKSQIMCIQNLIFKIGKLVVNEVKIIKNIYEKKVPQSDTICK